MKKEKIEYYSHLTVTVIGAVLFAYVFVKYLFALVFPFLIAWAVAFSVRPLAIRISGGTKIPVRFVRVILSTLILLGIIAILVSAVSYALGEAWDFFVGIKDSDAIYNVLVRIMNPISGWLGEREGAEELEGHIGEAIKAMMSSFLSGVVSWVSSFVSSVPRVVIFVVVTVVASVYFSLDLERINAFVKGALPKKASDWLVRFKNRFFGVSIKYIRSYLILMLITFTIMLFGFLVLRVKYAVLLAFVVALLDVLPLIGVGTILVPWSVYQMIFGKFSLGVGLMLLFVICELTRQFIEPKILGKNLGIHPILSIMLLYLGYYSLGLLGLLLVPLISVFINILTDKQNSTEVT